MKSAIKTDDLPEQPLFYTYILICRDGTFYTGFTTDLSRRLQCHNSGHGARYTRSRLPVWFVHVECCLSRSQALSREYEIKQLSRKEKLNLICSRPFSLCSMRDIFKAESEKQ